MGIGRRLGNDKSFHQPSLIFIAHRIHRFTQMLILRKSAKSAGAFQVLNSLLIPI